MAIFHFPPAQSTGGAQPYADPHKAALIQVEVDNPPFDMRRIATVALVVALAQPDPFVYPGQGGYGPYQPRVLVRTEQGVEVDNPPLQSPENRPAQIAFRAYFAYPDPWQFVFEGDQQPYSGHLNDQAPGLSSDPPSFGQAPKAAAAAIISMLQPDPWTYTFEGASQPYAGRKLQAGTPGLSIDNPPFIHPGRTALSQSQIAVLSQPDPWIYAAPGDPPGANQPYGKLLLNPLFTAQIVNNPPFDSRRLSLPSSIIALNIPDPWVYNFESSRQPYGIYLGVRAEAGVTTNPPPFDPRRGQNIANLYSLNQPSVWPYVFTSTGPQPYGKSFVNPIFEGIVIPPSGSGKRPRTTPFIPEPPRDVKPNKPLRPIWDRLRDQVAVEEPKEPAPPPPLPPPSIFERPPEADPTKMGLPTFDQVVPPAHVALTKQMQETQDLSDAIAVLQALGIFKNQG
jgi:hypothetical protein